MENAGNIYIKSKEQNKERNYAEKIFFFSLQEPDRMEAGIVLNSHCAMDQWRFSSRAIDGIRVIRAIFGATAA